MAEQKLQGAVVVITGASSGFGKGAALKFAGAGASLVLAARREPLLDELARECVALGGRAIAVPTDVTDPADVEQLAREAVSELGRIDVWVNNAGVGAVGRFDEIPLADHMRVIETDLLGTLYGCYFAMKHFRKRGSGTLINVASVIGKVPSPYYASYAAAKHGVVGMSASIRQELAENEMEEIHVCTVIPTSFDTPFFDHAANYSGHEVTPIPPLYDPKEVVDVIVRLATDPEDEVTVGTAATISAISHNLAPGMTEKMMGKHTHKSQIDKAAPAPDTEGNLFEPVEHGTGVRGGRLERKEEEEGDRTNT